MWNLESDRFLSSYIDTLSSSSKPTPSSGKACSKVSQKRMAIIVSCSPLWESFAEREWIDKGEGEFAEFFSSFIPNARTYV